MKCSKTSWYNGCVDLGPQKTQWTNTSRWHGTPNHHWLWKLYTGPQATWILCLSSLPPDSGTLISKGNAKFTFIREHNFGPLSSSPVETLLTLSVVQEWLDTRNATAETHVLHTSVRSGSWSTDSSCSPLFVNLPHIFEWVLFHNPLQGAVIPIACTLFSTTSFLPFASLLMCLDTELCEQPASLQWPFVSCPPCARCQWSSFGQLSSQQSSPWLCSLQN